RFCATLLRFRMGRPPLERARMRIAPFFFALCMVLCPAFASSADTNVLDLLIVVGASGEKEFERDFQDEVQDWVNACRAGNKTFQVIEAVQTNQLEQFRAVVTNQPASEQEFWIVLVGHGTFDGKDAKFNLSGPDLSATNCAQILMNVPRPIIF